VAPITARQGTKVPQPTPPKKDNYYFGGWYDAAVGGTPYTWQHTLNASVTMYARWTEIPTWTVSFLNHEDDLVEDATAKEGAGVKKPIPKKAYHTFDGWFSQADGGDEYTAWPHILKGNIAMYARWTPIPFTITFKTHNGTTLPPITQNGGTEVSPKPVTAREGFRFLGWFDAASLGTEYTAWPHLLTESLTMHAQWIRQYTITFETHGDTMEGPITQDEGTAVIEPGEPKKGGFEFQGWFPTGSGGVKYEWPYTPADNITMHAQWTPLYPVAFYPNGGISAGGSAALEPQSVLEGGTVDEPGTMTKAIDLDNLPAAAGLYTGQKFDGWHIGSPTGEKWDFNTSVTGPLNLYAQWTTPASGVNLSSVSGANTLAKALSYINGLPALTVKTEYTIVLDGTYAIPGVDYNTSTINKANAVITLVGIGPTEISLSSNDGYLFNIRSAELVLDHNITLTGKGAAKVNEWSLVGVMSSSTLTMKAGAAITDNVRNDNAGGGVWVEGKFIMEGGTISGNVATGKYGVGGGVLISGGSFSKTGGFIYGDDNTNPDDGNATDNTATTGSGHAVFHYNSSRYRNSTLTDTDNISTSSDEGWGQ
jgi:hypothetical protein